ncbi:MAG: tetratricopeptide repeat protein [Pseudomonadota bacterium]
MKKSQEIPACAFAALTLVLMLGCKPQVSCPAATALDLYRADMVKFQGKSGHPWKDCVTGFMQCSRQGKLPDDQLAAFLVCRAADAFDRGDNQGALAFLGEAMAVRGDMVVAQHFMTHVYLKTEQRMKAVQSAQKEVDLDKGWIWGYLDLAAAHQLAGDTGAGVEAVKKAVELDPSNAVPHYTLAALLMASGSKDACAELRKAAELAPGELTYIMEYFDAMAELNASAGQSDETTLIEEKWAAERLFANFPGDTQVLVSVAESRAGMGDQAGAFEALMKAAEIAPKDPDIIEKLFTACAGLGNCRSVKNYLPYLKVLEPPAAAGILVSYAGEMQSLGNIVEAEKYYKKAVAAYPDHARAHEALARIYSDSCRLKKAVEEARTAAKLAPGDAFVQRAASAIFAQTDLFPEALAAAQQAGEADPENSTIHSVTAGVLAAMGNYGEAMEELKKYIAANPASPDAPLLLGDLLFKTGEFEEAEKAFGLYCGKNPDGTACLTAMGTIKAEKGDVEEGVELLRKAAEQDPGDARIKIYLARALARTKKKKGKEAALEEAEKIFMKALGQSPPLGTKLWVREIQDMIPTLAQKDLGFKPFTPCQ